MKLNKIRETILAGALGLASLAGCATYQVPEMGKPLEEKPVVQLRSLTTEVGVTTETKVARYRVFSNVDFNLGDVKVTYNGFNTLDGTPSNRKGATGEYFGMQQFLIGGQDWKTNALVWLKTEKTDNFRIFEKMLGARDTSLVGKLGADFGQIQFGMNQEKAEGVFVYGKDLGKGFTGTLVYDVKAPFKADREQYAEFQLSKSLTEKLSVFGRVEMDDFRARDSTFVVGLSWDW